MKTRGRLPHISVLADIVERVRVETDPERLYSLINELIDPYDVINFNFGYQWPMWRSRLSSSEGFSNLRDLWHPPSNLVGAGRLNAPGQPLLYLSLSPHATFAEVGAQVGDYIHLMGYSMKEQAKMRCAAVGEVLNVQRSARSTLSDEMTRELNRILKNSRPQAARSWVYLDAFLATTLSDANAKENDYLSSRVVSALLFEKQKDVDAIWYPGVALSNSINFAVLPNPAARLFLPDVTFVLRIDRIYEYGIYDFSFVRDADQFDEDGTILWDKGLGFSE